MPEKLEKFRIGSENSVVELRYQDLRSKVSEKEGAGEVLHCFGRCKGGEPKDVKVGGGVAPGM